MNRMLISLTLCLSMLLSTPLALHAKGEKKKKKDEHLVTSLANEYMRAFAVEEDEDEEEDVDKKPKPTEDKNNLPKDSVITIKDGNGKEITWKNLPLTDLDKYKISFKMLDTHVNQGKLPVSKTVDVSFIKAMELVHGGTEGKDSLVHDINYSTGIIAETALAWACAQPSPDQALIRHNQAIIQELAHNRALFTKLDQAFKTLEQAENDLFHFYSPMADANEEFLNQNFYFTFGPLKGLNASPNWLAATSAMGLWFAGSAIIAAPIVPVYSVLWLRHHIENRIPISQDEMRAAIYGIIFAPAAGYGAYAVTKTKKTVFCHLQEHLIGLATYINTLREIYTTINENLVLKNHFVHARYLNRLFENKLSDKVTQLTQLLQKNTFKGSPSFWFSNHGSVLTAQHLMKEVRHDLSDALMAGGQLGALLSATRLYLDHQDTPARYSFVEFVDGDRPYIGATNLWNPRLDANKAVPSSFEMGGSSAFNMVLTGGNGLGKSTIMKGLLYAMLIAQTFGIAPADRLVMTPFSRMICHTNVTDNVAAGLSGFTAELAMKDAILKEYTLLKPNEFAITVFDELFKSTNPDDAAELSKQLCRSLAQYKNGMSIIATHLAPVTELETEGTHANYHPGSIPQGDGKPAKPTYTLEKGASFDHNAVALYNAGNK